MSVELSPAGAQRERAVPCSRNCGRTTWNHGACCSACLTADEGYDAHFSAEVEAEYREEKGYA